MARQNRRDLFDSNEVGTYHCTHRTVRRAWLCGYDSVTRKSYEHRRVWLQDRLAEVAGIFGWDVLAFAVMSNHFHLMIRNRPDVVAQWSDDEVLRRWWRLHPTRRNADRSPVEPTEADLKPWRTASQLRILRSRLSDISWFIKSIAEPIARRANKEDQCTGHFWEGRFYCQKLLDEAAILACTAYVDLNPVRANAAATPESSRFTSVYERVQAEHESMLVRSRQRRRKKRTRSRKQGIDQVQYVRRDAWLAPIRLDERSASYQGPMPSKSGKRASDKGFLAMTLETYLKFIDWTGRQMHRDGKRGRIPADVAPILQRIGLEASTWCDCVKGFGKYFKRVAGSPTAIANEAKKRGRVSFHSRGSPLAPMT